MQYDLCIAGGGPAGMMAGLLFARAGLKAIVLEKHDDFLRDFRGDTVHPSTLELMGELDLLTAFLRRPHDRVSTLTMRMGERRITIADTRHLKVRCPFIAMMPQWHFLDFLADAGRCYAGFELRMGAEATGLLTGPQGCVTGVRLGNGDEIQATLTIAADGRGSILRDAASLPRTNLGAPIDVLWFRLLKSATAANETGGTFAPGTLVVQIDRGDYWQCAYVVAKGGADALREEGLAAFRRKISSAAAELADMVETLRDWDQVKLLSVTLDRLERWHRPGLLAIGDAAHAMSPVGGVGINLAVQDAVAAANILAGPLARGEPVDRLLAKVQSRRQFPVRVVQAMQKAVHDRILAPLVAGRIPATEPPLAIRILGRFPLLQRIPARIVGLGVRREHIRSHTA